MRRWAKRLAFVSLLIAGLYAALYLLPANVFLGTSIGQRLLSRNPQRLRVEWASARSLWPGEVEVRGLRIDGDAARIRWAVRVDRGQGRIDLPGLLSRRFQVSGFEGTGVAARVDRHPPVPRTAKRRRSPWTLRMEGARVAGLRALEYGPLRLTGDGRAAGSFSAVIGRQVRVDLERMEMTDGHLLARGRTIARGLSLRAGLRLGPYSPRRHPGAAGFDFLSGALQASGAMEEVPVLRRIAGASTGPPRPGRLAVDVRVKRGAFVPGSRVELAPPVPVGSPVAATAAVVRTPAGPRLRVDADLEGFTLHRRDGPPILTSESLRANALTTELRLSRLIGQARDLRRGQTSAGWTLPAEVSVRGLRLTVPGRRASLEVTAGEARGRIDLPALLRREVLLDGVTGTEAHLRVAPEAPGPRPARTPAAGRSSWAVQSTATRFDGSCDAELGTLRLQGGLRAAGDLSWKDGLLTLDLGTVTLKEGRLLRAAEPLAREVDLAGALRFGPYAPRRPGFSWIGELSGAFEGRAKTEIPALQRLSGSPGPDARLTLDLRLDRGVLRSGTRMHLLQSPMTVTASVPNGEKALHLQADLPNFTIRRRTGRPLLTAEALQATTEIPHLHLASLLGLGQSLGGGGEGGRPPGAGDWERGREGWGKSAHEGAERGRPAPLAGWGLSPAEIHARALRLTIPGERSSMELTAGAGHGKLDLPALFQREARFAGLSMTGSRLRLLPGTGEPPERPVARPGDPPLWKAELADSRLTGDCQVDLGGFGFTSSLQAAGDLTWSGEALAVQRAGVELAGGLLSRDGETVAQDMSLMADAGSPPSIPPRWRGSARCGSSPGIGSSAAPSLPWASCAPTSRRRAGCRWTAAAAWTRISTSTAAGCCRGAAFRCVRRSCVPSTC
ncbi:MAG TPA: hypothetical protein VEL74_25600 [Thermoanaerobaculia bacterium]|nr:hypothetical protein [Thermoanaerobaculia bacterium]